MNRIQKLLAKIIPLQSRVIKETFNREPDVKAHLLDVDLLHRAFREAEDGYPYELYGLYRDMISSHAHLQSEFGKRKLAVLGDAFALTAQDTDDESQVAFITSVQDSLEAIPDWFHTLAHIQDSTLYPVSVTERVYKPSDKPGWRYEISELVKVNHHDLSWPQGEFSFRDTDGNGHFMGGYTSIDLTKYIIHRGHLLTSVPDWHGGPMRAVMFWWLFSVGTRDWWGRFLERFGAPFLEGSYDSNDDGTRFELEDAFRGAQRLFGIVVSKEAEIKLHQANTQGGGQAFEAFHNVANKEISKLVVGQTMSAESSNIGFGGGQGKVQGQVRDDIRQFDALMLAHTIKTQILKPLWILNSWDTPMPNVSFGGESTDEQEVTGAILTSLAQSGLRVTDDALPILSQKIGFSVERAEQTAPKLFHALTAQDNSFDTSPLIPTAERRAERKRQARRATAEMLTAASPRLAKIMHNDFSKFESAILNSSSSDDALNAIAKVSAEYDATEAAELFQHCLTSASLNAIQASDR